MARRKPVEEGVLSDPSPSSSVLVVAFGGLAMGFGRNPPFEFFRMLGRHAPAKKLYVRDHHRCWYHRGVRGVASDIDGTATALDSMIAATRATKTVMLGSSAGGYAALLFGRLLGATEVHAFGPQTFISTALRERHRDARFGEAHEALMKSGHYQDRYGDLIDVFHRTPSNRTRFVIHYCVEHELDTAHAERLRHQPKCDLRGYDNGGHNVVKSLRDSGEMETLLREILSPAKNQASFSA